MGNKSDMDESKRAVPYSRGQQLADEFRMQFFETSAKANTNVNEVFESIGADGLRRCGVQWESLWECLTRLAVLMVCAPIPSCLLQPVTSCYGSKMRRLLRQAAAAQLAARREAQQCGWVLQGGSSAAAVRPRVEGAAEQAGYRRDAGHFVLGMTSLFFRSSPDFLPHLSL